jgi:subtilisin-like proprotein convertase family protein
MKNIVLLFFCAVFTIHLHAQTYIGAGGIIPDDGSPVSFPITITNLNPSTIDTIHGLAMVSINLTHPYDSDLQFSLVAPNGDMVMLSYANGWDGDNYTNTHFTDTASIYIVEGTPPFSGYYKPQEMLGNLNDSRSGNGTWYLHILDMYAFADQGNLISWSITFGDHPTGPFAFTNSNLPIVLINTNGQDIPDDPKIPVEMKIIDNGPGNRNNVNDTPVYDAFAGIEIRGSSSQMFPKKSYGFETWDEAGEELNVSLLGMPEESDWILNANYTDKTLVRNAMAYQSFRNLDHYATRYKYVEVMINGMYKGIYIFSEKIKRDENRVDIAKLKPDQNSGDELTGGYIFKIDKMTGSGGDGWVSDFLPLNHDAGQTIFYQYEFPKSEDITETQKNYIKDYVSTFETVLNSDDFADPVNGFRNYVDEGSFIDYFIVNEISKNIDGYRLSTFIHKQRESLGGKLRMGPVWDYDIAWHNSNYCEGPEYTGWAYQFPCTGDFWQVPFWWDKMLQDTVFANNLKCRWLEKRETVLSNTWFDQYIDSVATLLNESQQRNFQVWPILGVYIWPNPEPIPETYDAEIASLKDWLHMRLSWLDTNMPGNCNSVGINDQLINQIKIYPNPANDNILIESSEMKRIIIVNAIGQIVFDSPTHGLNKIDLNISMFEEGVYIVHITTAEGIFTKRFTIIR